MITVNEYIRSSKNTTGYNIYGISAINTSQKTKYECSWHCHSSTSYCKENHVKFAKPYFTYLDPIYFGIISSLKSTGNYQLANVIFLVTIIPLVIYFLLVRSILIQIEIRKIKKSGTAI